MRWAQPPVRKQTQVRGVCVHKEPFTPTQRAAGKEEQEQPVEKLKLKTSVTGEWE